ncbi:hypothetical protein PRUPE_3G096900 [Prunus persica]|uniref:Uncharacterized protein n=1 Tax=Prunus persica TaxID=3760 RepID=A0A251PXX5_PRUPE|nr:hypothetical protein PRUPE_3G096900 [Prunus persica]
MRLMTGSNFVLVHSMQAFVERQALSSHMKLKKFDMRRTTRRPQIHLNTKSQHNHGRILKAQSKNRQTLKNMNS